MIDWLIDASGFMPRTLCGPAWSPWLIWTHRIADLTIFVCYLLIGVGLFTTARKNLASKSVAGAIIFGAFIVACGVTHFTSQLMFTDPMYRLDALAKVVCALVSAIAVVWTFRPSNWRQRG